MLMNIIYCDKYLNNHRCVFWTPFIKLNEPTLEELDFKQYANKTIILLNPDCDFPPPKINNTYEFDSKYKNLTKDCQLISYVN